MLLATVFAGELQPAVWRRVVLQPPYWMIPLNHVNDPLNCARDAVFFKNQIVLLWSTLHVVGELLCRLLVKESFILANKPPPPSKVGSEHIMLMAQLIANWRQEHIDHLWINMAARTSVVTKSIKGQFTELVRQRQVFFNKIIEYIKNQHFPTFQAKTTIRCTGQSMNSKLILHYCDHQLNILVK